MSGFELNTSRYSLGVPRLQLDPEIQAQMPGLAPALRSPQLRQRVLMPDWRHMRQSDLDRMLREAPLPARAPLVPRGAGPATPRAADVGDLLEALWKVPDIQRTANRVLEQAGQRAERDWSRLSPSERGLVITTGIVMGSMVLGGVAQNRENRVRALELVGMLGDIPVPGVDGLSFRLDTKGARVNVENAGVAGLDFRLGAEGTGRAGRPVAVEGMITFDIAEYLRSGSR